MTKGRGDSGYRDQKGNYGSGPYTWGNGPKPYGIVKRIVKKIQGK